jgi:formylglycine-generating enzyme required for sulfatase activity
MLDLNEWTDDCQNEEQTADPEQLVKRFRSTASPTARRLAEMMATVPVSWSVIRLIQKNLLREAETVHVAEVFLSGLLQVSPIQKSAESHKLKRRYEFVPEVRNRLISGVFVSETERVMENVADDLLSRLPSEVKQRLSEDIERRLGRSMRSFEAFLLPEVLNELPLDETTRAELLPFASVTSEVLQGLGGEYATLANQLQGTPVEPVVTPVVFPALQEFEFETGTLEETQPLQPFEFAVATVEIQRKGVRRQPTVVIHREQKQAWGYLEELSEFGLNLEMVAIPEGTFIMGSPTNEPERRESESPQHEVTVPPFFMGKYPVTQSQWRVIASLEQVNQPLDPDPSSFKGDNRPVESVSWLDAVEFCERLNRFVEGRLSQFTGKAYRLPSEAEWEYACRALPISTAGTLKADDVLNDGSLSTAFHFGDTITPELANYNWDNIYNKIKVTKKKDFEGTSPVGQFKVANNFGLYDLHGNVWEWCADHWHKNYEGAPIDGSAWINSNAEEDAVRVLRGGSWAVNPWSCRSAARGDLEAGIRDFNFGFRVVCSAPRTLP